MLFGGLFWAYSHFSLSPAETVGCIIPAMGVINVPYDNVPLFNTCLLTSSSLSVTLGHKAVIKGSFKHALDGFIVTIILGLTFLVPQINEYKNCLFNFSDGAYSSVFYMLTGLHGFHVLIGLCWLILSLYRLLARHFTTKHHLGLLFSIWYWHSVDTIWIGVYCFVHIWLANYYLFVSFISGIILGFIFIIWRKLTA